MNRLALLMGLATVVIACGETASPSASPTASVASSASPEGSPEATATPATTLPPIPSIGLAPFQPSSRWEPVLELSSAHGTDTGTFRVRGRYRLHQQCSGQGQVALTVATSASESSTSQIECGASQAQSSRVLDVRGRATVTLAVAGDPEWLFVFQVPVGD
ncbi:MAG: hypothetical protein H0X59_00760 [Chloroflexi bacterium]|nr:hypothetical protein [Chloroflexota bacterium]MDQ3407113.1 hypothetical protein [Chloroflexota bacterium]